MKPIAYINVEKRTLEFAEPIKWHTPTVANLDRIPLFTKEALAQEQEPVAIVTSETGNPDITMSWWHEPALPVGTKLYTIPPQRTFVGLTKEQLATTDWSADFRAGALWAEAKLKQVNGFAEENT